MVAMKSVAGGEKVALPQEHSDRIKLRTDIRSRSNQPLDGNILLALTLNDITCQKGHGFFYWLPSIGAMSQRRRRRRDMMEECAIDTEVVTGITSKKPSNADLIFLSDYQWTEIEKQRWIECNGACKQTLCQAQMNWWNGTPTLVLPVYANLLSPSAHYVPAGPEHDAQDGALIVLQETTSNDSFVTYFDTLNGLRDAGKGTGTKGRGESFNKAIIDRSKPRAQSYEDRLFKWASAWLASHRIEPNNLLELSISHATIVDAANSRTDQLIQRVENLAEERPSLLQLWDDAIERTYV